MLWCTGSLASFPCLLVLASFYRSMEWVLYAVVDLYLEYCGSENMTFLECSSL